LRTVLFVNEFT